MTELSPAFSVPQLAKLKRIGQDKLRGWIARGELRAVNLSDKPTQRPRWAVNLADWEAFENTRTNLAKLPAPRQPRNKKVSRPWAEIF